MNESTPYNSKSLWLAIVSLIGCAALATIAVSLTEISNRDRIKANQLEWESRVIREVLPISGYDNEPWLDAVRATNPELLGTPAAMPMYRARNGTTPIAMVITVVAQDGYVGPITLAMGIDMNDAIVAVRPTEHQETPGLGDRIDIKKSEWINAFVGIRSGTAAKNWGFRKTGGDFDRITGATVTSRAVINAIRNGLEFYRLNRDRIYAAETGTTLTDSL